MRRHYRRQREACCVANCREPFFGAVDGARDEEIHEMLEGLHLREALSDNLLWRLCDQHQNAAHTLMMFASTRGVR
jgi:hypothetical protein